MLCTAHHVLYDGKFIQFSGQSEGRVHIEALTDRNADGPLLFTVNGVRYEEAA